MVPESVSGRRWAASPILAGLILLLVCSPGRGQSAGAGSAELPPILSLEREVVLARSAAPASISAEARVLVLRRGVGYEVAEVGTNGVTCFVDRTWPESLEPWCMDEEASRTILPMRLRFAELREKGRTKEEIDRDLAEGLRTGRFRTPKRPAVTYMMSAAQVLFDDDGRKVGAWKPHIMIYSPHLTNADVGYSGAPGLPMLVTDEGEPTANLMVVVPEAVEPKAGREGPPDG